MTLKPIFAALVAAASVSAGAAFADTGNTAVVRYSDLDLASRDGQKALQHRVDGAVGRVCRISDFADRMDFVACRGNAQRDARAQLAAKGITAL